jgi:dihydroflavonol-4-reductase
MLVWSLVSAFIMDGTINPAGSGVFGSGPTMIVSARDGLRSSPRVDCLVTGATGLVGNNVARLLVNRNDNVRVLVRPGQRPGPTADARQAAGGAFAALPVDMVAAALHDEAAMQRAVDGTTHVIHSAAMVHCGWRHLAEMRHVNVEGTRVVARAARRAGARLIHVSSVDAIGLRSDGVPADEETPPGGMLECPYVVTKRQAEAAVLEEVDKGLDAVIVNPVYMIGPWDWKPSSGRMLLEVGAGRGLFAPPGSNDFVDVRDVAQGILSAMSRGQTGRRYILGGQPLSYLDAWRIFARVSGRLQPLGIAPRPFVHVAGWCGDLASLLTRRELPVNSAATGMSMLAHNFSCARAVAELGYTRRPFEAAAQDAWDWFVGHGYVRALRPRTALAR